MGDRRRFLTCLVTLRSTVDPATDLPKDDLTPEALGFLRQKGVNVQTVPEAMGEEFDLATTNHSKKR